jgi:hypothetical protein
VRQAGSSARQPHLGGVTEYLWVWHRDSTRLNQALLRTHLLDHQMTGQQVVNQTLLRQGVRMCILHVRSLDKTHLYCTVEKYRRCGTAK